jgi:hypothetical protein
VEVVRTRNRRRADDAFVFSHDGLSHRRHDEPSQYGFCPKGVGVGLPTIWRAAAANAESAVRLNCLVFLVIGCW